ncbi:phospholipid hydroperoxide glutathione peroxidase [Mizuhopecten yessoensis]|uniref:Phospholipid hydroperoxide glutathione peroxidase n=1 Tax=Mizuhopecten yessoensis TaxID=6573 RepID=A0A210R065_MIZYE|nr:phospholipid hydroperoxide glutathione peroxidase [Mizuhopecten yessoensis]
MLFITLSRTLLTQVRERSKVYLTRLPYATMASNNSDSWKTASSIYEFTCKDIDGNEEPGTNEEIKAFATDKYKVEFDMFAKIDVNSSNAIPLYNYLKKKQSGTFGNFIKWNFSKFLVNKEGIPVKRYAPNDEPNKLATRCSTRWLMNRLVKSYMSVPLTFRVLTFDLVAEWLE